MIMKRRTNNLRVSQLRPLMPPAILLEEQPLSDASAAFIESCREQAQEIIQKQKDRLMVILGPCSIHDVAAAMEYAHLLKVANKQFENELMLIMRVYFEKPRTTIGWKGLINDPKMDNSFEINKGLRLARELLLNLVELEIPTATEFLDTIIPQYIADLITWGAIGARTTESQIHRELASGLSMPIGFKNGTSGDIQIAIDAIGAAQHPHHFLGVTEQGLSAIVTTEGNQNCHIILRGAKNGPNYSAQDVQTVTEALNQAGLNTGIMIDCSHGNSRKDHNKQPQVANDIAKQIAAGNHDIIGVMLESHLVAGNQSLSQQPLTYGQSVTDACISWEQTLPVLEELAQAVQQRRSK